MQVAIAFKDKQTSSSCFSTSADYADTHYYAMLALFFYSQGYISSDLQNASMFML